MTSTLQMLESSQYVVARQDALGQVTYERHRPEQTLLYQLIEKHYPALIEQLAAQGKNLPT